MAHSHSRDHPISKGSDVVEENPQNPPPHHSAFILAGAFGLAALSYLTHGFVNSIFNPVHSGVVVHPIQAPQINSVVNLGYASYRGLVNNTVPDVVSFLGVPYARPPRRFRAPQPLDETPKEHEVEEKQTYPDFCVQGWAPWLGLDDRGGAGTEDCLKVNIYTPSTFTNTSSYPVIIYIHGGGFHSGNPRVWPFDHWVERSPTPFVAVSIYYRLSSLGFLASPDQPGKGVHAGPDPELLLNAGLHDQRMALKFVQKHIRSFGGDPERVTIMGQSAGAASVGSHLAAKPQEPDEKLFHRAILQSWYRPPLSQPSDRKAAWIHLAKSVGCYYWSWSTQNVLECLRQADVVKLVQAADEGMSKHPQEESWTWRPILDGTLFPDYPASLLREKDLDVDVIVGHTTHDAVFAGPGFLDLVRGSWPRLSVSDARRLEKMYQDARIPPEDMVEFSMAEVLFRCPSHVAGSLYGSRMYSYRFDEPDPVNLERASHSADNWILFEGTRSGSNGTTTFNPFTPAQRALSDETISYIVTFAATGDPNAPRLPSRDSDTPMAPALSWPSYPSGKRMVFRAEGGGTTTRGLEGGSYTEEFDKEELERCMVWQSLEEKMGV